MTAAAVLYVRDLRAMRAFYEACFGLSLQEPDEAGFCILQSPGFELSLVRVGQDIAASIADEHQPRRRTGTPIKLAFEVVDLDAAAARVITAGGRVRDDDRAWEFRGRRHRDCVDPEGNVVQLRQLVVR